MASRSYENHGYAAYGTMWRQPFPGVRRFVSKSGETGEVCGSSTPGYSIYIFIIYLFISPLVLIIYFVNLCRRAYSRASRIRFLRASRVQFVCPLRSFNGALLTGPSLEDKRKSKPRQKCIYHEEIERGGKDRRCTLSYTHGTQKSHEKSTAVRRPVAAISRLGHTARYQMHHKTRGL